MVGVAVNVTLVPGQILPAGLAAIVTDGANTGLTVMFIAVASADAGVTHTAFDVS